MNIDPKKIRQQISILANIANVVTPENAFALYFLAVLNQRKTGRVNTLIVDRLRIRLQTSVYWQDKFKAFGLSLAEVDNQEVDLFQEPIPIFPQGYVGPFADVTKRQVIR